MNILPDQYISSKISVRTPTQARYKGNHSPYSLAASAIASRFWGETLGSSASWLGETHIVWAKQIPYPAYFIAHLLGCAKGQKVLGVDAADKGQLAIIFFSQCAAFMLRAWPVWGAGHPRPHQ